MKHRLIQISLGLALIVSIAMGWNQVLRHAGQDPERARFMLECTYDWQLAPETCRKILQGENPPPASEVMPGC